MPIDPERLIARRFAPVEQAYTERETILYALGLGLGSDPLDRGELRFVYEDGLAAMPTMANVLGYPGFWAKEPDTGIDWRRVVHAEQAIVLHRPLAPAGRVVGKTRVTAVYDKGAAKGALLCQERSVLDAASGAPIATVSQVSMLRGDGGFGGDPGSPPAPHPIPDRLPDAVCELPIPPQAALIYRLSGDLNPLHADPEAARAAGFERPIMHGMATMGIACHAALKSVLGYEPSVVAGLRARFTAPIAPGETLRTEFWRDGAVVSFRASAGERGIIVLNAGRIDLRAGNQMAEGSI